MFSFGNIYLMTHRCKSPDFSSGKITLRFRKFFLCFNFLKLEFNFLKRRFVHTQTSFRYKG